MFFILMNICCVFYQHEGEQIGEKFPNIEVEQQDDWGGMCF